jgi:hemerythrin superfamily protein
VTLHGCCGSAQPDKEATMSHDAIVILREDHKEVRALFREFQASSTTDARKGAIVDKVIELLTVHTYIENEVMYPQVRELLPDLEDDILESFEEHHVADVLVSELAMLKPGDERFEAKTMVLIENVTHHMDEEESDWFPKVREGLGRSVLVKLGEQLLAAKERAPRSPAQPSALKKTLDAMIS